MRQIKFEEEVFFTTTRITISKDTNNGTSIGTGFLYQVPLNPGSDKSVLLLISNKHVFVNPKDKITFNFNKKDEQGKPDFGNIQKFSIKDFSSIYTEHPDTSVDLACINASAIATNTNNLHYRHISPKMLSNFDEDSLIPGLDVWFVGYPENRFDVKNNLPILRKGYVASLPKIDFNDKKQFVIDAQVFQGSSGSPVFAPINGEFKLIGVVTETMIRHGELETTPTLHTGLGVTQILGLGLVIKATLLKELVEIAVDKVKDAIEKTEEPTVTK